MTMSTNPPLFKKPKKPNSVSTTNACKLCKPLGACLAFKGIEGAVPYLHGSQGCATYMRRYIISHFREPIDIASSSLGEKQAIYGGAANLKKGLLTVMDKYGAGLIGAPAQVSYPHDMATVVASTLIVGMEIHVERLRADGVI
mgnify:CR=1 FL=1